MNWCINSGSSFRPSRSRDAVLTYPGYDGYPQRHVAATSRAYAVSRTRMPFTRDDPFTLARLLPPHDFMMEWGAAEEESA